ncbi:MAG: leucine-rich repeat domain-containing protein [Prevotella sp.]|nr:leucine-rich repeat domain-containing protein [Prevotella sp.]
MKRIRLFLVLSLLSMAMTKSVADTTDSDGRIWSLSTKPTTLATLTGVSSTVTSLEIPASVTISGTTYTVAGISAKACKGNTKLKSVSIKTALAVGANAFENCIALDTVGFNGTACTIGKSAFRGCKAITGVGGADAVTAIGDSAFANCTSLIEVYRPLKCVTIGSYAFYNCTKMECYRADFWETYNSSKAMAWGEGAFMNCTSLNRIVLPINLATIPKRCFYGCKNLNFIILTEHQKDGVTHATYHSKLQTIGEEAFMNCTDLKFSWGLQTSSGDGTDANWLKWFWPASEALKYTDIAQIGNSAFKNCTNFFPSWSIVFPSTLYSIGDEAFAYCTNMGTPTFTEATNLTSIGTGCFRECDAYWGIDLTQTKLTAIPDYAFYGCGSLWLTNTSNSHGSDTGDLNGKIKTIGENAFAWCSNMDNLVLDKTTTSIGNSAFYNCADLRSVTVPSGNTLATIGDYAFWNDQKLATLSFPSNSALTTIGACAFGACHGITNNFESLVYTKLKTVGARAFENCINMTGISFPATIEDIDKANPATCGAVFANDTSLVFITVVLSNTNYKASKGHPLVTADGKTLVCYPAKHTTLTGYNPLTADYVDGYMLPAGVETISSYAFQGCQDEHFVLPKTVKTIGANSFAKCTKMTEITIPDNVTLISSYVFDGCSNLQSIYFLPRTVPGHAGSYSFNGLASKVTAYVKTAYLADYSKSFGTGLFKTTTNIVPYLRKTTTSQYESRCFDFDVDMSVNSNLTAYTVSAFSSSTGQATLSEIKTGYLPARIGSNHNQASYTGVIVKCTATSATFQIGDNSSPASVGTNYLVGCPAYHRAFGSNGYTSVPNRYYALKNGKFCRYTAAGRITYNHAYLDGEAAGIPANYGADVQIVFFDEEGNDVTAVEKLENGVTETEENGAYYNLNGVKVENPSKGIYIRNGKKVVIK